MSISFYRHTLFIIVFCLTACKTTKTPVTHFDPLEYFSKSAYKAGLNIDLDTSTIYYRSIHIQNALNRFFQCPESYLVFITPRIKIEPGRSQFGDGLPILKDSNGLTLFRMFILGKQPDALSTEWVVEFFKDSIRYETAQNFTKFGNVLWFARKFRSVMYAQNKIEIDSLLSQIYKEQVQVYFYSAIQKKLKNYPLDSTANNNSGSRYYKGENIHFPGDTLNQKDSADFRNCVIKFRQEHGLDPSLMIDSTLLTILKIPIHPIEEGLKRYWAEKTRL
jgi:hypothetical protein